MKTSPRAWIPSTLLLIAACEAPSTELGSTRVMWTWVAEDDEPIDALATTPDDEVVVILSREARDEGVLRKHAPDGSIAWSRESVRMIDVGVDATGTIVVLGLIADDAWSLLAHTPNGDPLWETQLPAGSIPTALGILADRTIIVATNVDEAAEVMAFLPTGAPAWSRPLADAAAGQRVLASELGTAAAGPIVVGGYVAASDGTLDSGQTWVARLSATGEVEWLQTAAADGLGAVAIDDDGAPFIVGQRDLRLWLRRLDPAGALAWERIEPFAAHRSGYDAAIGDDGTLYWAGVDHTDATVVALAPDGSEQWQELVSGPPAGTAIPDEDIAVGVALAPTGELVAAGALDYRGRTGGSAAWFRGWLGRYATDE